MLLLQVCIRFGVYRVYRGPPADSVMSLISSEHAKMFTNGSESTILLLFSDQDLPVHNGLDKVAVLSNGKHQLYSPAVRLLRLLENLQQVCMGGKVLSSPGELVGIPQTFEVFTVIVCSVWPMTQAASSQSVADLGNQEVQVCIMSEMHLRLPLGELFHIAMLQGKQQTREETADSKEVKEVCSLT